MSARPHWSWFLLAAVGVLVATIILVMVAHRAESSTDFRDFWENAVHLRATGEIAADLGVHNYLPFFTIFMLPWGFLPLPVAAVLFVGLSLAFFALTASLTERMLMGTTPAPRPRAALVVTLLLALPYVYACAVVGNVGLLVLFLIVASWFLVEHDREWEAGAALGLATLIKLLPAALIVFFLLKRRWRVAGAAAATVVVLGVGLPLFVTGPQRTWLDHVSFYQRAVAGHSAGHTLTAEHPGKAMYSNVSLPMTLRRLLSPVDARKGADRPPLVVCIAEAPAAVRVGVYVVLMTILSGASLWLALRSGATWPPSDPAGVARLRAEFGVWCALLLLASPLVWTHYLPLVYWPLALVAERCTTVRWLPRRGHAVALAAVSVWFVAAILLAWPRARAAGAPLWAVLVLWVAVAWLAVPRRAR